MNKCFRVESLYGTLTDVKQWSIFGDHFKKHDFIEKRFVLIDISHDISLAYLASKGDIDKIQLTGVPNRKKLYTVFKWLYKNRDLFNLIVCDVLFTHESLTTYDSLTCRYINYDDSLAFYIDSLDIKGKIILAGEYSEKGYKEDIVSKRKHFNEESRGYVNCDNEEEARFMNYKLAYFNNKTEKSYFSLPLKMYEKINHKRIYGIWWNQCLNVEDLKSGENKASIWNWVFYLNKFVPEFYYNQNDLDALFSYSKSRFPDTEKISMITLNEIYFYEERMRKVLFGDTLQRRNIFIGSFDDLQQDKHDVIQAGMMSGSTIVLNVYYNLLKKQNKLSVWLLVWIFTSYFLILSIYASQKISSVWLTIGRHFIHEWHYYGLALLLIVLSFWFNITLRIIILEFFLFFAGIFLRYAVIRIMQKNESKPSQ